MNYTYDIIDLMEAMSNNNLRPGDHVTYDQRYVLRNGGFNSLNSFKEFLSTHCGYKHLIGEEYYKGLCFYEISEMKNSSPYPTK